ncbi:MAG TPA: MopE-related protein [Flavobacteriaceae bacterium]|nr:MopE-related protein [Flavobacteriaceae bacterium]
MEFITEGGTYPKQLVIETSSNMIFFSIENQGLQLLTICDSFEVGNINLFITEDEINLTPCNEPLVFSVADCSTLDNDNDGYTADVDCNDDNASVYPGAEEICDGQDNDCNGAVDEGLETTDYYWDADLDGYGNPNLIAPNRCASPGGRYVEVAGDCDDSNAAIHPGATEIPDNGIDDDCNPATPDSALDIDNDGDGQTENEGDCDDTNANVYAGNTEIPYNGVDDDCNPTTLDDDLDGDGYPQATDCDDSNTAVNPGATEIPDNGIDDDCNPETPDSDECLLDSDNDGTPDCYDECPNDRKKIAPGDCGCGVMDRDRDNDGVADCNDVCDRADDTIDVDNDRIPDCIDPCIGDSDSDNDGIADCNDLCPGQNDTLDSDGDSVPDCLDICPEDPENLCANNPCAIGEVLICHARNNGTFIEMCVRENQLQRHLDHGDTLGTCATFAKTETPHLNLYPNPVSKILTVNLEHVNFKNASISLFNAYGTKVYQSRIKDNQEIKIDVEKEIKVSGLYYLVVENEDLRIIKRVVISN